MFDDGAPLLEVFLFDFDGDLYGQTLDVAFIGWIRHEQKFELVEVLKRQIAADAAQARDVLKRAGDAFFRCWGRWNSGLFPPHPEEPAKGGRLEGWGGPLVRDASLRDAPHHEGRDSSVVGRKQPFRCRIRLLNTPPKRTP